MKRRRRALSAACSISRARSGSQLTMPPIWSWRCGSASRSHPRIPICATQPSVSASACSGPFDERLLRGSAPEVRYAFLAAALAPPSSVLERRDCRVRTRTPALLCVEVIDRARFWYRDVDFLSFQSWAMAGVRGGTDDTKRVAARHGDDTEWR